MQVDKNTDALMPSDFALLSRSDTLSLFPTVTSPSSPPIETDTLVQRDTASISFKERGALIKHCADARGLLDDEKEHMLIVMARACCASTSTMFSKKYPNAFFGALKKKSKYIRTGYIPLLIALWTC